MKDVITHLKDVVRIEQITDSTYNMHLPIMYYGGDWVVIEVSVNNNTFSISDKGFAILNAQSIVNNIDNSNYKRSLNNISKEYGLDVSTTGTLYLNDVTNEQLYASISDIANASQKLSNIIIENAMQQEAKKIRDLVQYKLQNLFKDDYKKKVIVDYEVIGNSSKQYSIPFCIDNDIKRFIEPLNNNATAIAAVHTKFFDIGKDAKHSREIAIDDFGKWDSPNIELLKPICEKINPYNKIAI